MSKFYAGIGARETPTWAINLMVSLSEKLEKDGYTLRSGGASGADSAFERGATKKEIFRPKNATLDSLLLASEFHPRWDELNDYVKKLHARNCQIILGQYLDSPVKFAVCWTKNGEAIGGTGQAIRLCNHYNIPIFNIALQETLDRFKTYLNIKPMESLL